MSAEPAALRGGPLLGCAAVWEVGEHLSGSPGRALGELSDVQSHYRLRSNHRGVKYRDSFEFSPFARLLYSANRLPSSGDSSQAFYDRWLIVPFANRFRNPANNLSAFPCGFGALRRILPQLRTAQRVDDKAANTSNSAGPLVQASHHFRLVKFNSTEVAVARL